MKRFSLPFPQVCLAVVVTMLVVSLCGCRTTGTKKWYQFWAREDPSGRLYPVDDLLDPPDALPRDLDEAEPLPPDEGQVFAEEARSIPETPPTRVEPRGFISELKTVFFDYDRFTIRRDQAELLRRNADWILRHRDITIQVEGHCDERGTYEYNIGLGQKRADMVREELARLGVDPLSLTTISYGDERPIDTGEGEAAWSKNRRVQFQIY